MGKREKKFVLRIEYAWDLMQGMDRAVDELVNKGKANLMSRGAGGGTASTELGRFASKSEARRIGETLKGKLGKKARVELKIREART